MLVATFSSIGQGDRGFKVNRRLQPTVGTNLSGDFGIFRANHLRSFGALSDWAQLW
jgi:hypothetical protein